MDIPQTVLKVLHIFPPRAVSSTIRALARNKYINRFLWWRETHELQDLRPPLNILCIGDVNLGDGVNLQVVVDVLNERFPDSTVDYVHSRTAQPLVEHNPGICRNVPLFTGRFIPTDGESQEVRRIAQSGRYDLVLNLCPFLSSKVLGRIQPVVVTALPLVAKIIANLRGDGAAEETSMNTNLVQYVNEIAGMISSSEGNTNHCAPVSPTIHLSESALVERDAWMSSAGVELGRPTVLHNPDASNRYTLINETLQVQILRRILKADACEQLLVASGFTFEGIERRLVGKLPVSTRDKITIIPRELPIDAYTALLDASDVFITGDTGPLHLAAAAKKCVSRDGEFRNQTAICSLFGPTLPLVYGYDSQRARYGDAGQEAPARVFEGGCVDKSMACSLARITGRCSRDACFAGFEAESVVDFVLSVLTHRADGIAGPDERVRNRKGVT